MKLEPTLTTRVLDFAVAVQQIPAPTFGEAGRAAFLQRQFGEQGALDVTLDEVGNLYARLPGAGQARPLVVSAHTDTVFPAGTDLQVRRSPDRIDGPGIGDNSLGVAGLMALLWRWKEGNLRLGGDLWLVANVCEEGLGDLRGMKAVVDRFGAQPLAYIVLEGMALGHIYHRGLGVQRYQITCSTAGGHSWMNYGRPSAIHELAALVGRLTALPLPATPRTTMNVGIFQGGTSVNTIAAEAHLELDLRSEDEQILLALAGQVEKLVEAANVAPGSAAAEEDRLRMSACIIGKRPAGGIPLDHPLLTLACCCLEGQGLTSAVGVGSTDANVPLSRGLPAVTIGLTYGGGAHTLHEFIQTAPLAQGLGQMYDLVESAYGL